MIKYLFSGLIVLYAFSFTGLIFRGFIANKIVKISQETIDNGSMNFLEFKKKEQSFEVRNQITKIFRISSVIVFLLSIIVWKFSLFTPIYIPKYVAILSGIFAITFILANEIRFIPTGPLV